MDHGPRPESGGDHPRHPATRGRRLGGPEPTQGGRGHTEHNPTLGRALGALDYFVKPVNGKALLSRLRQYRFTTGVKHEPVRVLVVDDEPANLDLLEGLLRPEGFGVLRAASGREGIDMAMSELPNLILLDLMMPGLTGFDVVEALRDKEATRSIPIMVLTSKELTDVDKSALNGQVSAIFQRNSVAGTELTAWLRSIVAKRQFG
ncbi:MAG: response regulator [Chloroflexi bacterium]|nr:MAG: response regulator [Chloroflexota bacterium]